MLFYNDLDQNNQKILCLPSIFQFERTVHNLDHPIVVKWNKWVLQICVLHHPFSTFFKNWCNDLAWFHHLSNKFKFKTYPSFEKSGVIISAQLSQAQPSQVSTWNSAANVPQRTQFWIRFESSLLQKSSESFWFFFIEEYQFRSRILLETFFDNINS